MDVEILKRFAMIYFSLLKTDNSDFEIFRGCCQGFLRIFECLRKIVHESVPQFLHLFSTLASFAISEDVESTLKSVSVLVGSKYMSSSDKISKKDVAENTERNIHFILSLLVTTNVQEILVVKLCETRSLCLAQETTVSQSPSPFKVSLENQLELILDLFIQILQIEMGKNIFPQMLKNAKQKNVSDFDFDSTMDYLLMSSRPSLVLKALSCLALLEADFSRDSNDEVYSPALCNSLGSLLRVIDSDCFSPQFKEKVSVLFSVLPIENFYLSQPIQKV
jgi:hypothetical protein